MSSYARILGMTTDKKRRPRDLNALAASIVDAATNEERQEEMRPQKTKPPWNSGDLVEKLAVRQGRRNLRRSSARRLRRRRLRIGGVENPRCPFQNRRLAQKAVPWFRYMLDGFCLASS